MKKLIVISFLLFCGIYFYSTKKNLTYSFYHWENSYDIKNSKDKLYIKVLDIAFSKKLEIIKTKFLQKPPPNFIPVIYITNDAMKKNDYNHLVNEVSKNLKKFGFSFNEIQIDCDWTMKSRWNYFEFLKSLKKKMDKNISATIRLHQIKFFKKTGVPPVDYGVLMYYNMSYLGKYNTKNSILDNEVAKKYHHNFDIYPLKLKLALPLYSQAISFRDKMPLDIYEGVKKSDFDKNFEKIGSNFYKVTKSRYFKGRYIYKNDIFRFEDVKMQDIKLALNNFFSISKNSFDEIILFRVKYKNKFNPNSQ